MYFKIRGGERAIAASHRLIAAKRRGDIGLAEIETRQISEQLSLALDRVMTEGALYDRELAALAIKQAQGDLTEAAFLLRATRASLERIGTSEPLSFSTMIVRRRVSTTHKDVPGGQILGPTYDYTLRLLDPELLAGQANSPPLQEAEASQAAFDKDIALDWGDYVETEQDGDQQRAGRLEGLARGDEGFLLALAYSSMRGYGGGNAFLGEIRYGDVIVELIIPELGIKVGIGQISVTECQSLHSDLSDPERDPQMTRGYGVAFGQSERKAIASAIIDRSLRRAEFGQEPRFPIENPEFVLGHCDSVSASGVVQVMKLPHYVHFQGKKQLIDQLRAGRANSSREQET